MARRARKIEPSSGPRPAQGGIKARSSRGEFARNWWARRWLQALERLIDVARLQRGRNYARMGQVLSIEETRDGGIAARVQGSRTRPYKVKIRMSALSDKQWEKVLDVLADQAIFAAQLLAGEMPSDIEEAFAKAGVSLFPNYVGDLITECSCPDWANPCKHIAAAHYILGDRFDEDPFLIFRLRGRTQSQILEGLRRHRGETPDPEEEEYPVQRGEKVKPMPSISRSLDSFWRMGGSLQGYTLSIKQPDIPMPIFRRLGDPDVITAESLTTLLEDSYAAVSQAALIFAYHGGDAPTQDETDV